MFLQDRKAALALSGLPSRASHGQPGLPQGHPTVSLGSLKGIPWPAWARNTCPSTRGTPVT